jgi:hypothetical protein
MCSHFLSLAVEDLSQLPEGSGSDETASELFGSYHDPTHS